MLAQHRLVKQKQIFGSRKMQLRDVTAGNTGVIVVIPKYSDALKFVNYNLTTLDLSNFHVTFDQYFVFCVWHAHFEDVHFS